MQHWHSHLNFLRHRDGEGIYRCAAFYTSPRHILPDLVTAGGDTTHTHANSHSHSDSHSTTRFAYSYNYSYNYSYPKPHPLSVGIASHTHTYSNDGISLWLNIWIRL